MTQHAEPDGKQTANNGPLVQLASVPHIQTLENTNTYESDNDHAQRMRSDFTPDDADLADLVEAWTDLNAPIWAAIMALIRSR